MIATSATSATRRKPGGARPGPSHSSSSSSSGGSGFAQTISGARSAVPYSEHGGVYEPSTSSLPDEQSHSSFLDVGDVSVPAQDSTLQVNPNPQQYPSRSTTPKPKLKLLQTGGGVAASIGANDPDVFGSSDAPALPPLKSLGPSLAISIGLPTRSAPKPPLPSLNATNTDGYSQPPAAERPTLRPPPIGGGSSKKRGLGLGLAIPMGSAPIGAIGADEPDAIDLIGTMTETGELEKKGGNGHGPGTPLNLGGDADDVTVRPALPQGHSHAKSIDKIKEMMSPTPSSASSTSPPPPGEDDWAEAEEYLVDIQKLGEGAGGEVYKVEDKRTGIKLARKIIQARTTPPRQLVRELKNLKDTTHQNIVRFYGAYISPSSSEVKILMEFCEGGSLEAIGEKIKQQKRRISEPVAAKIAEGIFNGLAYLHSKRIIHRDIKPSNVLVSRAGQIKLCDFGVSGELVDSWADTWTGTSMYMAPERIQGGQYSIRSDVWSSGLTLMTLAQNRFPYPDDLNGIIELINYITKEEIPKLTDEDNDHDGYAEVRWSANMKDFIAICLTREESKRPKPSEMLLHPWLAESAQRKVPMAQWIREVWDWEKKDRGRPPSNHRDSQSEERRPSAVRKTPSMTKIG